MSPKTWADGSDSGPTDRRHLQPRDRGAQISRPVLRPALCPALGNQQRRLTSAVRVKQAASSKGQLRQHNWADLLHLSDFGRHLDHCNTAHCTPKNLHRSLHLRPRVRLLPEASERRCGDHSPRPSAELTCPSHPSPRCPRLRVRSRASLSPRRRSSGQRLRRLWHRASFS